MGLPALGIAGLVVLKLSEPAPKQVEVEDPNENIRELEDQIGKLEKEFQTVIGLLRSEDPTANTRASRLSERIDKWMVEWDTVIDPLRDKTSGDLPPEYKGYQHTRSRVNTLRLDLLKSTNL